MVNSTFFENQANGNQNDQGDDIDNSSKLTMSDTLMAEKSAHNDQDIAGTITSAGYNLIDTSVQGRSSTDRQVAFADLKLDTVLRKNGGPMQTLKLLPGSPALDAIPEKACNITITDVSGHTETITTDERGSPRLHRAKNTCDIGAI